MWLCDNDGVEDINLPSTEPSRRAALELRMTAISLGMHQYAVHVENAFMNAVGG